MSSNDIKALIETVNRFTVSAEFSFNAKDYNSAVSRTYYATFFPAEAILLTNNLATKSHSGLIALFFKNILSAFLEIYLKNLVSIS